MIFYVNSPLGGIFLGGGRIEAEGGETFGTCWNFVYFEEFYVISRRGRWSAPPGWEPTGGGRGYILLLSLNYKFEMQYISLLETP